MRFKIKANFKENLNNIFRACGYRLHPKYEDSYIRRLSSTGFYPRWHLYFKKNKEILEFDLHLDQKKESYGGHTAHSGEYEDYIVTNEAKRIISIMSSFVDK